MKAFRPIISSDRARSWLALLAFLVSWAAPIVHETVVDHVVCAEHGELAHGSVSHDVHGAHDDHDDHGPLDEHDHHHDLALSDGAAGSEHDEHCEHVVMRGPRRAPTAAVALPMAAPRVAGRCALGPAATPRASFRLYRMAPKGSPPVAC